ncbi:hypothetical protein N431DRAFT_449636 [Stipitochalara longipes BDJ]|nr:hypothetical protein N431DRAFT_449636 [Stipitochalara longipes BDJ]
MYRTSMFMYISFYPKTEHLILGSIPENWVIAKPLFEYDIILSLIQCSQSVPFAGDLEIFWALPDGVSITSFRTTLEVPLNMSTTVYGNSVHAFSSYISTSSSEITDTFAAKDGLDRTYNITLDGIGENSNISNYSIGNGTNATSYEIDRVIPVDVYTKFGFRLSLNELLWSFGDVVWKNTEVWVTDVRNHDWCDK